MIMTCIMFMCIFLCCARLCFYVDGFFVFVNDCFTSLSAVCCVWLRGAVCCVCVNVIILVHVNVCHAWYDWLIFSFQAACLYIINTTQIPLVSFIGCFRRNPQVKLGLAELNKQHYVMCHPFFVTFQFKDLFLNQKPISSDTHCRDEFFLVFFWVVLGKFFQVRELFFLFGLCAMLVSLNKTSSLVLSTLAIANRCNKCLVLSTLAIANRCNKWRTNNDQQPRERKKKKNLT